MFPFRSVRIRSFERGLKFRDGELVEVLRPGWHWWFDPLHRVRVDVSHLRAPWLEHPDLDLIVKSGALGDEAQVVDLKDHERALVWIDGRFDRVLGPGLHAVWTANREIRVERVDARSVRLEHQELNQILASPSAALLLERQLIPEGQVKVYFRDGEYVETLKPGQYGFWRAAAVVKFYPVELRESVLDVGGQEIMTSDKVTLRLNLVATYRVVDPLKSVTVSSDVRQALYRDVQLGLRAVVGARELDPLLADKDLVVRKLEDQVRKRAGALGLEVLGVGIRDVILPGEMKELMNRVTEARKAAEATLIARREETAAMRSQANTAKLLENNPTLMRLRELEVLEKVAVSSKLNVVLGEKGLADRVVNLL